MFLHNDGISEIVLLNLQEAYSLSVLMYASPALALQNKQINELNACWNNVGYHRWESVKAVIYGFGRLNMDLKGLMLHMKLLYLN